MEERDWQAKLQRLASSDTGFAAGLLVAQLFQFLQKLSDEMASLKTELSFWRTQIAPLLEGAAWQQTLSETLRQVQATLTGVQQLLAGKIVETLQQGTQAQKAVEWASRTMGYSQILRQLVADAESATDLLQFARANSVRLEELTRPFTLPADESEISWLKPILEAEGERYRQDAISRLAQRGITVRLPEISTAFDPQWQNIVGGVFTEDETKRDTIVQAQAPAIFVNGEIVLPARVEVWKPK